MRVVTQPREPSGDYGYDLAHEQTSGAKPGGDSAEHHTPASTRRDDDQLEDLAYDEAHDF